MCNAYFRLKESVVITMPELLERKDGCFYIHHFYRNHSTWQVDRKGIFFLRDRGVNVGDKFSTDLFLEMWRLDLVYTGTSRKQQQ